MSQTEKDHRVRSLSGWIRKCHILFVHGCSLSLSTNARTHTHTHTNTRKKKLQVNTDHKNKCIIYIHKLTGVHTHTHEISTYMGIVVTIQKDPEFPPRLYTEVPHTVCPRLLSLIPQMPHTHTRKKKIQVNTDHKNKCII